MAPKSAHVASDFDKRAHFNTLRVKPEYRISLRMGDLEELFPQAPGTPEGRMERMQVLGLFYFPLEHKKAKDRFPECWKWFKDKILGGKDDAAADKAIQDGLKSRVVSGAATPGWSAAPTGLPADAADPDNPAPENFAKIRIPGGYTVQYGGGRSALNKQTKYKGEFAVDSLYDHETFFHKDNPVLGKIPLVAKVEKRLSEGDPWQPAKDVFVHFQLLPAYAVDKPVFDPAVAVSAQFQRPPMGDSRGGPADAAASGGPKKQIDKEETGDNPPAADDPQGQNAHHTRGGKRGQGSLTDNTDVADKDKLIFSVKSFEGFNEKGKRKLPHKPYPVAEKAKPAGTKHLHAVRAKSNEEGEAGALFMPSRCGGDRYRIRAYIGPPTSPSDGTEVGAVRATTGTFIVWRNIRVSRYVRQEVGAAPDATLLAEATAAPYSVANAGAYLRRAGAHDGASHLGLGTVKFADPDAAPGTFMAHPMQFAKAFCEVELDTAVPESLTLDEWDKARKLGVADAKKALKKEGINFDLDVLFCTDVAYGAVNAVVCNIPMRSAEEYNKKVKPSKRMTMTGGSVDPAVRDQIDTLCQNYVLDGFQRHLTKDGGLPGITLIYGGMGYTWQILFTDRGFSGIVQDFRGSFLWYGDNVYTNRVWTAGGTFPYDCTSNACHELGHAMFRPHGVAGAAGGAQAAKHDPEADCLCVMSYGQSIGHYCGFSLLTFRGWNVP